MSSRHVRARRLRREILGTAPRFTCCYCQGTIHRSLATLEHIVALCCGGTWERQNLTLACKPCNSASGGLVSLILEGKTAHVAHYLKTKPYLFLGIIQSEGRWCFVNPLAGLAAAEVR